MSHKIRINRLFLLLILGVLIGGVVVGLRVRNANPKAELPLPLSTCSAETITQALDDTGNYQPSETPGIVRIVNQGFVLNDAPYPVRGVNYYPSRYPWRRFLTETDLDTLQTELALLRETGFNTLRIFLWNEALFQCPGNAKQGSGAVPQTANFKRLDAIIQQAAAQGFRLIVTLNDLPDLTQYPLYTNPPHIQAQTAFIVQRYRDEAAILAWDMRNEGDIDYGSHRSFPAKATKTDVLAWLDATAQQIRALDPHHLLTAGWLYDADATSPYVDFVSFHHWEGADQLCKRIGALRASTQKPILLQEFGYSTHEMSEDQQADTLREVIEMADQQALAGWLIWAAFDFPLDRSCYPSLCTSPDNREHDFGLWTVEYAPKSAVEVLKSALVSVSIE